MFGVNATNVGVLAALLAGSIVLSGCCGGSTSTDEDKPATPAATTAAATTTAAAAASAGDNAADRPRVKASDGKVMDAAELQTAFFADKDAWKGKTVRIKGLINSTQDASKNNPPMYFISLRGAGQSGYQAQCGFTISAGKPAPKVKNAETVTVQCKVAGDFFKAVKVEDCELEE